jgi:hypothetical protein
VPEPEPEPEPGATVVLHGSSPHNLEAAKAALLQARPPVITPSVEAFPRYHP